MVACNITFRRLVSLTLGWDLRPFGGVSPFLDARGLRKWLRVGRGVVGLSIVVKRDTK